MQFYAKGALRVVVGVYFILTGLVFHYFKYEAPVVVVSAQGAAERSEQRVRVLLTFGSHSYEWL